MPTGNYKYVRSFVFFSIWGVRFFHPTLSFSLTDAVDLSLTRRRLGRRTSLSIAPRRVPSTPRGPISLCVLPKWDTYVSLCSDVDINIRKKKYPLQKRNLKKKKKVFFFF